MTYPKIIELDFDYALRTKNEFDTVRGKKEKPDEPTSGFFRSESALQQRTRLTIDSPNIAGSPKSHNTLGATMTIAFHKYPDLRSSEEYQKLTFAQRSVFVAIIEYSTPFPCIFDFFGSELKLESGQCCTTHELIKKWSGGVSKKIIRNCLEKFEDYGWMKVEILKRVKNEGKKRARVGAHERAHVKTLITLKFRGIYESNKELKGASEGTCLGTKGAHKEDILGGGILNLNPPKGDCGKVHNSKEGRQDKKIKFMGKRFINLPKESIDGWIKAYPNYNVQARIDEFASHLTELGEEDPQDLNKRIPAWVRKGYLERMKILGKSENSPNPQNTIDQDKEYAQNVPRFWDMNNHELDVLSDCALLRCGNWNRSVEYGIDFQKKIEKLLIERKCRKKK